MCYGLLAPLFRLRLAAVADEAGHKSHQLFRFVAAHHVFPPDGRQHHRVAVVAHVCEVLALSTGEPTGESEHSADAEQAQVGCHAAISFNRDDVADGQRFLSYPPDDGERMAVCDNLLWRIVVAKEYGNQHCDECHSGYGRCGQANAVIHTDAVGDAEHCKNYYYCPLNIATLIPTH